MQLLSRLERFAARFFGLIILPAQLPGDPLDAVLDLKDDPVGTLKSWKWSLISQLVRQICTCQKITIPDDPLLERLHQSRTKFLVKGWSQISLHTADGLKLDGYIKAPADARIPPRYIIFVGGNSQKVSARESLREEPLTCHSPRVFTALLLLGALLIMSLTSLSARCVPLWQYEDWLPYFDLYANDSGLGFLCFNFRGVARSEGGVSCLNDMLLDLRAAYEHLTEGLGVVTSHIVFHGFSIGAAVASCFLAQPDAPRCAITSDRSFRSFCHAAFAICRGPTAAIGDGNAPRVLNSSGGGFKAALIARLKLVLLCLLGIARAALAQIAVLAFRHTGWELDALGAWPKIQGPKILIYNTADNIVNYAGASLHFGLLHACSDGADGEDCAGAGGEAVGRVGRAGGTREALARAMDETTVVEATIRDAQGWALHDCPLSLDHDAWYGMIRAERAALGLSANGGKSFNL